MNDIAKKTHNIRQLLYEAAGAEDNWMPLDHAVALAADNAADEIERLSSEVKRYRKALEKIAHISGESGAHVTEMFAKAALVSEEQTEIPHDRGSNQYANPDSEERATDSVPTYTLDDFD